MTEQSHHVTSQGTYYFIFGCLMVLTALTVWVAYQDFGPANVPIAIGIAVTKATLVVLFFMHVMQSPKLTALIVWTSIAFLGLLFLLTLSDYLTRFWPVA